ncbi:hypothetical protein PIB30_045965 [Stylosanthes scabra]|uniref:Dof zinc finger protein n=1 Tax=Stylosanthes scabra TaxID=79078 RepID=A0ABU6SG65_9FABA|nr:hypothetical protein [Stylosanthes scabra]
MQDPTTVFQPIKPQFPEQEQLKCPRCDSTNTKFCYYNNYNLSQPRHFCKNCRRYWTKGVSTPAQAASSGPEPDSAQVYPAPPAVADQGQQRLLDIGGSFSSLLASTSHLGSLLEGLNSSGSSLKMVQMNEFGVNSAGSGAPPMSSNSSRNPGLDVESNGNNEESFLSMHNGDSSCWNNGSNGWSNLAIFTPGSSFQ